ncbi:hypothetical protein SAMN06295945_0371 [Polynucleobacter meluiroseus]|uniref:DinB family protein n=1 Tax=Polynucleobacter meluiroseus TaxID=1938814 RepID=A0A240E0L6_9BURK|nr:hypothetical protein [Polynucleobacter meluiroseus]SNX28051.1 hypothetical protein SAMN06295945_0371 [Polynucleobacter meluiroseus]
MTVKKNAQQLIDYTIANLGMMGQLAAHFHLEIQERYRDPIGAHIRHIIEHYETLIFKRSSQINYDTRQRDISLEENPVEAENRLAALSEYLHNVTLYELDDLVSVSSAGGLFGEVAFINQSSVGRELCFLNSHAIHHLAIIKPACKQLGIPLDEYFGFASSTVAHLESQKMEVL